MGIRGPPIAHAGVQVFSVYCRMFLRQAAEAKAAQSGAAGTVLYAVCPLTDMFNHSSAVQVRAVRRPGSEEEGFRGATWRNATECVLAGARAARSESAVCEKIEC